MKLIDILICYLYCNTAFKGERYMADLGTINGIVFIAIEEGLNRVMGNKKLYVRLLTKFRDETKLVPLLEALEANDLETAKVQAHTLKGVSANLSLQELYLRTQELEAQIKEGTVDPNQVGKVGEVFSETRELINKVIEQYGNS